MARSKKIKTGAGTKATRKARIPSNGNPSAPSSTNPSRALLTQREIAAADRESDLEDQSTDSDTEAGTPNTRGRGRVSNQLAMPVKPVTELPTKEAERLRTELQQN